MHLVPALSHPAPLWEGLAGLAIMLVPVAALLVLAGRRVVGRADATTLLVAWGAFIVVIEHLYWGLGRGLESGSWVRHEQLHLQMAAFYGAAALALMVVIAATLLREGRRAGWFALLAAFAIGMVGETVTAVTIGFHGDPAQFLSWGLALWAYPVAWVAALALSYRPVFRTADHAVSR